MKARPAVFLDRDGTLVRDIAWCTEPGELELLPGVLPALRALRVAGYALVVASNQAGVARGLFDLDEARKSGAHLAAILAAAGCPLDGYYFSPYHEREGRVPTFRRPSEARKPGADMLRAAAADLGLALTESWIVGDHLSDVAAGLASGGRGILLDIGQLAWPVADAIPAILHDPRTLIARNLPHAADLILATESSPLPTQTLVRGAPPLDQRAPGEPCPWPDDSWLVRAAADGRRLASLRRS